MIVIMVRIARDNERERYSNSLKQSSLADHYSNPNDAAPKRGTSRLPWRKQTTVLFILTLIVAAVGVYLVRQSFPSHSSVALGSKLTVNGSQIFDNTGTPVVLRGAMVESSLAYNNQYNQCLGGDATKCPEYKLNPTVFAAMAGWHMNAVRINTSGWMYQETNYMSRLDTIVSQANAAGLYVVIDFHDDQQSGSPYGSGAEVLKAEDEAYWQFLANHYKNNGDVLFDLINEPNFASANQWLNGGGTVTGSTGQTANVLGYNDVVAAIRATGATQIIVVEGHEAATGNLRVNDPSVMYTEHTYSGVINDDPTYWSSKWGNLIDNYPLYYGEWAVLPDKDSVDCTGLTSQNAGQITADFLDYMNTHHISWTAWEFGPPRLVSSESTLTPTTFVAQLPTVGASWSCKDSVTQQNPNTLGMGRDVKNFLSFIRGDANNDGAVSVFDLSIVLSHYSQAYGASDFNSDGTVNIFDLSILLSNYGS
jgi:hypothetical protein